MMENSKDDEMSLAVKFLFLHLSMLYAYANTLEFI